MGATKALVMIPFGLKVCVLLLVLVLVHILLLVCTGTSAPLIFESSFVEEDKGKDKVESFVFGLLGVGGGKN